MDIQYVMLHHTGFCASISFSSVCRDPNSLCPLSILHLFANLIAEDLVPVNLGASDWELPA